MNRSEMYTENPLLEMKLWMNKRIKKKKDSSYRKIHDQATNDSREMEKKN